MKQVCIFHYSKVSGLFSLRVDHDDDDSSKTVFPSQEWLHDYNQWFTSFSMDNFTLDELQGFNQQGIHLTQHLSKELEHQQDIQVVSFLPVFSNLTLEGGECKDGNYGFPVHVDTLPISNQLKLDFLEWKNRITAGEELTDKERADMDGIDMERRLKEELTVAIKVASDGDNTSTTIDILFYDESIHRLLEHPVMNRKDAYVGSPSNIWMEQYKQWNQKVQHFILNGCASVLDLVRFNQEGIILRDTLQEELGDDIHITFTPVLGSIQVGCTWWHIRDGHYRIPLNIQKLPVSNSLKSDFQIWNRQTSNNPCWLHDGYAARIYEQRRWFEERLSNELHYRCMLFSVLNGSKTENISQGSEHPEVYNIDRSSHGPQDNYRKLLLEEGNADALVQLLKHHSDHGTQSAHHRRYSTW